MTLAESVSETENTRRHLQSLISDYGVTRRPTTRTPIISSSAGRVSNIRISSVESNLSTGLKGLKGLKGLLSPEPERCKRSNKMQEPRGQDNSTSPAKDKMSKWQRILLHQAKEFCLSTGLHGYKYIAQKQRSKTERIIWGLVVVISLCIALVLMWFAWAYNVAHPTLTVIATTHHGISNYPFPAVTICDINRISLSRTEELVRNLENPFSDSQEYLVTEMRLLNELLSPGVFGYDVAENLTHLQEIFDLNNLTVSEVVRLVTKNCSDLIAGCEWKGVKRDCHLLFEDSLSRDGWCCSFNYLGVQDATDSSLGKEPERLAACGVQTGLTVIVNVEPEDYHATIFGAYGIKLMLHDSYDYPDYNAETKLIGTKVEVFMSILPELTYSTEGVRQLSIPKRNCIFEDEKRVVERKGSKAPQSRSLNTNRYSYHNCLAQCRAAIIKTKCHCIPYYYPQNGTRICDLKDLGCLADYRSWYETSWPGISVNSSNLPRKLTSHHDVYTRPCGCLPDCTLVRYPVEGSSAVFSKNHSYHHFHLLNGMEMKNHSMVHVFFSDLVSSQYRRDVYYNWLNLFASFGGLLGLFAGFSLMSGCELIYFFSIRIIADIWMKEKTVTMKKTRPKF